MAPRERVTRPLKSTEYEIRAGSRSSEKAWRDLVATKRNLVVNAWDTLTREPLVETSLCYRLRGPLARVIRDGQEFERWQLKLSIGDGARIWYYVEGRTVVIEAVHTHHPNETK